MLNLRFNCPSCGTKLAPLEASNFATQVVKRTCRICGERWQLKVEALTVRDGLRFDKATFTFLGRAPRAPEAGGRTR